MPDRVRDAQEVLAQDAADGGGGIAETLESGADLGYDFGRRESGAPSVTPFAWPDFRAAAPGFVELRALEHVVEPECRVLGPDELGEVVDVPHDDFGRRRAGAEEEADAVDPDDAAGGGAGPNQVVRDVARMVAQRPRVGVREDHGPVGRVEDLSCRAVSRVGAALDHADSIHLGEDRTAEVGESGVLRSVAAATGKAAAVGGP